jgi:Flp pilus assembly protein TadD
VELGKDYLAADRVPLALRILEQAQSVAATYWDLHATMAVALDTLGRNQEAQAAYGRALELSPDNPAVLNNLGLSQALSGRLDEGIATLTHAGDLPTASAQIRQNLALLLALKGDAAQAEKLTRNDLPPDLARSNIEIMRAIAAAAKR